MAILDLNQAMNNNNTTAPPCHAHAAPASDQRLRQAEWKAGDDADNPNPRHQADAEEEEEEEELLLKGVRHLCERGGITRLPARYVLPPSDRPAPPDHHQRTSGLTIPVIDLARLRSPGAGRAAALVELDAACRDYGFFQVVGHGVGVGGGAMLDVARRFFELPFGERARHMSPDIRAPVRYGTSFNQLNDGVLCWRDFLKLVCDDLDGVVPSWPDAPADLREVVSAYARSCRRLFRELMEAALEAIGIGGPGAGEVLAGCDAGSQMLMVNCFPACPEPDLTLGMPPHSDYGFLTVLLQDQVNGLEVRHADSWVLVDPIPGSLVVNVGDHFEMYSNGRYKSVLHRVRVNSARSRISVASLHSLPPARVIGPAPELVDDDKNPRRYMDTDLATFLDYLSSAEGKHKSFLQTRRLLTS
ncbi:hypothetical protein SETIT_2G136600v2 [Setaria italica]|uniref:Fe2OG dioxygenase domain-containing protein n=1 Tax=Setaria italica TaxID=4555 RepID=K3ZTP5_SETIT|nr:protein DMR6-LIKE OXYGENASE 1 [Setaria italica]RCV10790.1 hypothetical protein SETIT_2G136600v2 [Setaria italica]